MAHMSNIPNAPPQRNLSTLAQQAKQSLIGSDPNVPLLFMILDGLARPGSKYVYEYGCLFTEAPGLQNLAHPSVVVSLGAFEFSRGPCNPQLQVPGARKSDPKGRNQSRCT